MTILIPAYKPDLHMPALVREIREQAPDMRVLVVDDGSGAEFEPVFIEAEAAGAVLLRHETNRGKGAALKTGFTYLKENGETEGCVTADADGQHTANDIFKVAALTAAHPGCLIMGGRKFNRPGVPLRSKAGNYATRFTFNLLCGQCIGDTQTGLRGIPADLLSDMCDVPGDRYEYEMQQLLRARQMDVELKETEIATVYLDEDNSASHFNPARDAMRVYLPVVLAGLGLILAAVCDVAAFLLLYPSLGLFGAAFAARGISYAVRGLDLLIRRKGRRVKLGKFVDFTASAFFAAAFSSFFAYLLAETVTSISPVTLKLLGELLLIVYICVLRAIKIRRVR